jgi:hypothetical protein
MRYATSHWRDTDALLAKGRRPGVPRHRPPLTDGRPTCSYLDP